VEQTSAARQLRPRGTARVVGDNDGVHPAAALPAQAPAHFEYAEEAKRAAQRYFEQLGHIEQLTTERDDWRSRALAAENEVTRLLRREAALLAQIDSKSDAALKQAEDYKTTLTVIGAQYASAAKLLLDGFAALDKAGLRAKIDTLGLAVALKESGVTRCRGWLPKGRANRWGGAFPRARSFYRVSCLLSARVPPPSPVAERSRDRGAKACPPLLVGRARSRTFWII
jgi:hypothetical protein